MKALQYIYTSWKNGDLPDKGFMIYSKSEGITDKECEEIKFVMQYHVPKDMIPNPTPEQISDDFPYNFACFRMSEGRYCVAQSSYLGKDYSGRFGNYIIYALVFEYDDLEAYPAELFAEDYIKNSMTEEELNAVPPVPALPPAAIDEYGSFINDQSICEFVAQRRDRFSMLLSACMFACSEHIPVYINDTRENIVLWMAAVHRVMPLETAKNTAFASYVGNHEKFLSEQVKRNPYIPALAGVRPDANYFSYPSEVNSSRHYVFDFLTETFSKDIKIFDVAAELAESYCGSMDEIYGFISFLEEVGYYSFGQEYEAAWDLYCLYKKGKTDFELDRLEKIFDFTANYCSGSLISEIASDMVNMLLAASVKNTEPMKKIIPFLYTNGQIVMYSVHDIFLNTLIACSPDSPDACLELVRCVKAHNPSEFNMFLDYIEGDDTADLCVNELQGDLHAGISIFFGTFIINNYSLPRGLQTPRKAVRILKAVIKNLVNISGEYKAVLGMIESCNDNIGLMTGLLSAYCNGLGREGIVSFGKEYAVWINSLPEDIRKALSEEIIKDPNMIPIVMELDSMAIKMSDNAEKIFKDLYLHQFSNMDAVDISGLAEAFLSADSGPEAAIAVLETVPVERMGDEGIKRVILSRLEDMPYKKCTRLLMKNSACMKNIIRILMTAGSMECFKDLVKMKALYILTYLISITESMNVSPGQISLLIKKLDASLRGLDRSDYGAYSEDFTENIIKYLMYVNRTDETAAVMNFAYNPKYFSCFCDDVIKQLKKLQKSKPTAWINFNALLYAYISDGSTVAREFGAEYVKYYKKLSDEEMTKIGSLAKKYNTGGDELIKMLLKDSEKKNGIGNIIGSIFSKKA